jgi:hypothetical protein
MDTLPQRVLVHELKRAIDLIPRDRQAVTRVRHLVEANPRSARSSHVLRNLGSERVRVLGAILSEPLAARVPPRARAGGSPGSREAEADDS